MYTRIKQFKVFLTFILAILIISGCSTLTYRDIQRDYNLAVQSDNLQTIQPIPDSFHLYAEIIHDLSNDNYKFIKEELDPKIQANAYTILALSQWRSEKLKDAKNTIEYARKIKSLVFAPRDKILCDLIPYLVDEKDLLKRHPGKDGKILSMTYSNTFENNYPSLVSNIEDVSRVISNETSPQIIWYVYYQRWRVLNNWRNIINTIWDGTDVDSQASIDLRKKARDNAKSKLGGIELKDEIKAQLEEIPEGHPLRNLAKFQERL